MQTTKVKEATLQVLIMPIQNLYLALKLEDVQKVIRTPEIFKGGQQQLGIAHIEDREAVIIDLHQKIFGCPNPITEQYVILLKAPDQTLYGVLSTALPTINALPLSTIHPLPCDYRDRDSLGIASHTASIRHNNTTQTLFLLDPARILVNDVSLASFQLDDPESTDE